MPAHTPFLSTLARVSTLIIGSRRAWNAECCRPVPPDASHRAGLRRAPPTIFYFVLCVLVLPGPHFWSHRPTSIICTAPAFRYQIFKTRTGNVVIGAHLAYGKMLFRNRYGLWSGDWFRQTFSWLLTRLASGPSDDNSAVPFHSHVVEASSRRSSHAAYFAKSRSSIGRTAAGETVALPIYTKEQTRTALAYKSVF